MAEPTKAEQFDRRLRRAEADFDRLIEQVGKVEASISEHDTRIGNISKAITGLAEAIKNLRSAMNRTEEREPPPPVASWIQAETPERATTVLADLEEWLGRVLVHYPNGVLKDCWRRHAWVVEELLALRDRYDEAWAPGASSAWRLDWHDRHRPNAMARIKQGLGDCGGLSSHVIVNPADFTPPRQVGLDDGEELAQWWVGTHGRSPAPAPGPAALHEANTRRDEELRPPEPQWGIDHME